MIFVYQKKKKSFLWIDFFIGENDLCVRDHV